MGQQKNTKPGKRLVWRITADAPLGEFVDPDAQPPRPATTDPEPGGWVMSSFDLLHGADISEGPDTVPDDVFDELFRTPDPKPKPRTPG